MENPVRNDWVLQVQKDLQDIGLGYLSMQDIKSQSKESFKSLESCSKLAFSDLMKEKEGLSNLTYGKMQDAGISLNRQIEQSAEKITVQNSDKDY